MTKNQKKARKQHARKIPAYTGGDHHIRIPGQDVHVLTQGEAHGSIEGPRGMNTYPREQRDKDAQAIRRRKKEKFR